ncbi:DegT/DnrJ/EryC1/StrS family aminotransferase [Acholeplasma laidlawii]|uniref:DegT/DnrJ/EryC1/StrS family aminotransferase n=1 Tax=Acholeplasma laidlawii TaxID=2148 RepID=UPI0021F79225|nr:DegT/DnrJ/EryC1/StrS family aminotransferase [Acholeplasma laidlawii]
MKMINVTKSSLPSYKKYSRKIKKLWKTKHLTNLGFYHNELEMKLSKYLLVENLLLYNNGHSALEFAFEAIMKKGEIITTPFTFSSTTHAIIRTGNTPVFCDVKYDYTIDESKIEELITEKTIAIAPVHVYGNICNVDKISEIAKKYNLMVIYDSAHVFGTKYKDKGIGTFGDISMFSLHATKVFHSIEGGALTFNDNSYKEMLTSIRNFGQINPENIKYIGGNGKMDEFRAAMGLTLLEIIDSEIGKRKLVYERYIQNLKHLDGIKLNYVQSDVTSNYAYFPVLFENYKYNRNEIYELLKINNIISRKYFYPLTSEFSAYKGLFHINETPLAKHLAKNILCLPLYADLNLKDVDMICNIIKKGVL